jgi:hypothetical protein
VAVFATVGGGAGGGAGASGGRRDWTTTATMIAVIPRVTNSAGPRLRFVRDLCRVDRERRMKDNPNVA